MHNENEMDNECELVHGAFRKSEERYRSVLKTAMDGFCMADAQGCLLEVNDAYCRMIGYSEPELLTMNIADLDASEKEPDVIKHIKKVLAQGTERFETRHRRKDGSVIDVEISVQYRTSDDGRLIAFLRDITERKRSEELLRLFKESVENSSDAFGMSTAEGKHFYQNEAFNNLFGEIGDNPPATLYVDENIGKEVFKTIMAGGRWVGEVKMYAKDKSVLNILLRAYAIKDANGRVIGLVGIHTDITERRRAEDALRESENYIKVVMDNLPIGVAVNSVDPAVSFQYMNDNFPKLYRTTREALASPDRFWSAVYEEPEFREEIRRRVLDDCASDEPARMHWVDVQITRKGEETTYIEARNTPLPDKRLMVSTVWDVTGRKQAEKEREQFFKFFQTSADLMCIIDPNGAFIKTNPSCTETLGYSEAEIISKPFIEFIHPDDRQATLDEMAKQMQSAFYLAFENRYICRDGSVKWLSWRTIYNKDEENIYATARDITERKNGQEALRESENRLRFALEGTNDGLWDVQVKTGEMYLSPRGCEILGYRADEIYELVRVWSDLVHPDDLPLTNERLQAHIEGRAPIFEVEQRLSTKSGDWKWVLTRGKVVARAPDGTPLRITGTNTDLTEQKKLEAQLRQSQKMEAVGQLAGGVAHDFNNMLTVILGYAEIAIIQLGPKHPLCNKLLEIRKAAERSADLTQQLLAFARKQTVAPKVLDLNETVENILKMLRRLIGEDIDLAWLPKARLWPVKVDPAQVDQVLANLCVNARDAIAGVGKVTIETGNVTIDEDYCAHHAGFVPGEYVMLAISDDGCGMDKTTLDKIFEPFFTTKGLGQGTGLGLATVYGIVKQNDGFINVYSEPARGTTFKIYLPRHWGNAEQVQVAGQVEPVSRGNETVLLVEDEPSILYLSKSMLEGLGYKVLAAGTPREAILLAEECTSGVDLLMTDVVMPEMNGQNLAKRLLPFYPNLKLLFMSGYTANVIAHHGVLDDGIHFLQKPFSMQNLASKVREVLDSK
jgi:PAS domain S-box-containing protein